MERKRISRTEFDRLMKKPAFINAAWSAERERVICMNGGRGWRETFKAYGTPVFEVEVSDAHDYARVYRVSR